MEAGVGVELGGKVEKQNICSNRKKKEASWIGAKSPNRGKSPKAKKKEASWIGGKVEKKNICSNKKKRREKQVGVKKQKKEELLQERNKITKIKISGGKSTWIL